MTDEKKEATPKASAACCEEAAHGHAENCADGRALSIVRAFDWFQRGDGRWDFVRPKYDDAHELHEALFTETKS